MLAYFGLMLVSLVVRDDCGQVESKFHRLVAAKILLCLLSLSHCSSPGFLVAVVFNLENTQSGLRQSQSIVAHTVPTLLSPSGVPKISPILSPLPGDSSTVQYSPYDDGDDGDAPLLLRYVPDPVPLPPPGRLVHELSSQIILLQVYVDELPATSSWWICAPRR